METKQELKTETKEVIIDLLKSTKRDGIDNLINYLDRYKYFDSPSSTKYHGSYFGGLADHSLNLFMLLDRVCLNLNIEEEEFPTESKIITALLHNLCKAGQYIGSVKPFVWNRNHPLGHGKLSINIIETYIRLTPLEKNIILYHMGYYQTKEFVIINGWGTPEYDLNQLSFHQQNRIIKLFHWVDDMATQFIDKNEI